jgi:two-component system, OmpR family, sensor histidine kinase QseC
MTLALLLACGLVWVAVYLVGRSDMFAANMGGFDREVRAVALAVARAAAGLDEPREVALALRGLDAYLAAQESVHGTPRGFLAFRVFDSESRVVASGGAGPQPWPRADERSGFYAHSAGGQTHRMHRSSTVDGRYRIEISQSHASRQKVFDEVMFSFEGLKPVLFGFPLLLLPMWLAVHTGLLPLRRLSAELASRHPADLTPIRAPLVVRELAPLARELNGALARLAALLQRERDFLADAAHKLRTPLALIGAQCDTLLHAQSDTAREAALQRLQGGLLRAGRLVNQLLALARLEADVENSPVETDIADVARDGLAAHAAAARAQGIELACVGPDSLKRIRGMRWRPSSTTWSATPFATGARQARSNCACTPWPTARRRCKSATTAPASHPTSAHGCSSASGAVRTSACRSQGWAWRSSSPPGRDILRRTMTSASRTLQAHQPVTTRSALSPLGGAPVTR